MPTRPLPASRASPRIRDPAGSSRSPRQHHGRLRCHSLRLADRPNALTHSSFFLVFSKAGGVVSSSIQLEPSSGGGIFVYTSNGSRQGRRGESGRQNRKDGEERMEPRYTPSRHQLPLSSLSFISSLLYQSFRCAGGSLEPIEVDGICDLGFVTTRRLLDF